MRYADRRETHTRKCEICECMFSASLSDQKRAEYRCGTCRVRVAPDFRKPERGEFNPRPGRRT